MENTFTEINDINMDEVVASHTDEAVTKENKTHKFLYFLSFFLPVIGFILGSLFIAQDDADDRKCGLRCIIAGIFGIAVCSLIFLTQ